jgi:hypothetical protein
MIDTECWLPVVGYENCYEVSSQGRVRSLTREVKCGRGVGQIAGRILKTYPTGIRGYPTVKLSLDGRKTGHLIHRLMLLTFIGEPEVDQESCHRNDIPTDNRLENLRWDTHSRNMQDVVRNGNHDQASKTVCDSGHEFTEENTIIRFDGRRGCKACKNANARKQYAAGRHNVRKWGTAP